MKMVLGEFYGNISDFYHEHLLWFWNVYKVELF